MAWHAQHDNEVLTFAGVGGIPYSGTRAQLARRQEKLEEYRSERLQAFSTRGLHCRECDTEKRTMTHYDRVDRTCWREDRRVVEELRRHAIMMLALAHGGPVEAAQVQPTGQPAGRHTDRAAPMSLEYRSPGGRGTYSGLADQLGITETEAR